MYKEYLNLLIKLVLVCQNLSVTYCCTSDCSQQAVVPCDVITSKQTCYYNRNHTHNGDFPDKMSTFQVSPVITFDGRVGLDVSWINDNLKEGKLQGYQLRYWSFIHSHDPSSSVLDQCVLYNFTSLDSPAIGAVFNHTCVMYSNRVIQISTQPQEDPDTDYVHRVTMGYTQDYGFHNPAHWRPPLVVIHNDSCRGHVDVQLYLAPPEFGFTEYRVSLVKVENIDYPVDKDIKAIPGDKYKSTVFINVAEGYYYLHIVAEPDDKGEKCWCDVELCEHCVLSTTNTFLMTDHHPKCTKMSTSVHHTTTEATSHTPPSSKVIEMIVYIMLLVLFICALITFIVVCFCRNKNSKPRTDHLTGSQKCCVDDGGKYDKAGNDLTPDSDNVLIQRPLDSVSMYDTHNINETRLHRRSGYRTEVSGMNGNHTILHERNGNQTRLHDSDGNQTSPNDNQREVQTDPSMLYNYSIRHMSPDTDPSDVHTCYTDNTSVSIKPLSEVTDFHSQYLNDINDNSSNAFRTINYNSGLPYSNNV